MNIDDLLLKANLLNLCETIDMGSGQYCHLIKLSDEQNILYIPDNVTNIYNSSEVTCKELKKTIHEIGGTLKVVGCKNLRKLKEAFVFDELNTLDLTEIPFGKIFSPGLFKKSTIYTIELPKCKIKSDRYTAVFLELYTNELDLRKVSFENVTDVGNLFYGAYMNKLKLNRNTLNIKRADFVFQGSKIRELDLSRLNLTKLEQAHSAFVGASFKTLKLGCLDLRNLKSANGAFSGTDVEEIDLSELKLPEVCNLRMLFHRCKAKMINFGNLQISRECIDDGFFNFYKGNIKTTCEAIQHAYDTRKI